MSGGRAPGMRGSASVATRKHKGSRVDFHRFRPSQHLCSVFGGIRRCDDDVLRGSEHVEIGKGQFSIGGGHYWSRLARVTMR